MPERRLADNLDILRSKGISESLSYARSEMRKKLGLPDSDIKILLLSNRDSDNVGDQVIEECARSLIRTALRDLGIRHFHIKSRAAGMISKQYLETHDESLLKFPTDAISDCDIVVFGGSPVFNYHYQSFYERTITTLELAEQLCKPVIFSAIGVENYEDDDERCQKLKHALNLSCVKQITTRDNLDALNRFVENSDIPIAKVSDPAVSAALVFRPFLSRAKTRKIGLFVIREHAFRDNGFQFTRSQAAALWVSLARALDERGLDYEFISSGHFSDEAFLELLISEHHIPESKCVFNVNAPEDLVERISSYDAIVSCRLHPSIIAYALEIPSVGIVWNEKVAQFYETIDHPERIVYPNQCSASVLADLVESALHDGVTINPTYLLSNYVNLRKGLALALGRAVPNSSPSIELLKKNIAPFRGTSRQERNAKLQRKFRRAYAKYNYIAAQNTKFKKRIRKLKHKITCE